MRKRTIGRATIYQGDCNQLDVVADAICTDPPWGCRTRTNYSRFTDGGTDHPRVVGDDQPFDPSDFLRYPKVCLFGYPFFAQHLPVGSILVWNKRRTNQLGKWCSDAELGWINQGAGSYVFQHVWHGVDRESERGEPVWHPNQKPIQLWKWVFCRLGLVAGQTVYDPYMGSGSAGVAAIQCGLNYVGCEIVPEYWKTACQRLAGVVVDPVAIQRPPPLDRATATLELIRHVGLDEAQRIIEGLRD